MHKRKLKTKTKFKPTRYSRFKRPVLVGLAVAVFAGPASWLMVSAQSPEVPAGESVTAAKHNATNKGTNSKGSSQSVSSTASGSSGQKTSQSAKPGSATAKSGNGGSTGSSVSPTPSPTPAASPSPTPAPTPPPAGGTSLQVQITYYAAYDNDPPGTTNIAHPVIHQTAGGVGSYADPLTFASPAGTGAYAYGTIIYVPSIQKYFIREDLCAGSHSAPNGCGPVSHVDLYVGNPSTSAAVEACENSLTPDGNATIILNPPSNLTYDPTPLWNEATGVCATLH